MFSTAGIKLFPTSSVVSFDYIPKVRTREQTSSPEITNHIMLKALDALDSVVAEIKLFKIVQFF
jgi:hypothetical protein